MLPIRSSKIVPPLLAFAAIFGWATGFSQAGDHGYTYYSKVYQHGSLVAPSSTGFVTFGTPVPYTSYYVAPMVTTYYTGYGLTSTAPATTYTVAPNYYYYPTYTTSPSTAYAAPVAPPIVNSITAWPTIGQPSADYVKEYEIFLKQEADKNPPTILNPIGTHNLASEWEFGGPNYRQLAAIVGYERLAFVDRFLFTKRYEPNFRVNALKLFERILGIYLPQHLRLVQEYLDDLLRRPPPFSPKGGDQAPPAPAVPTPEPPKAPVPAAASPSLKRDPATGHFIATDATGTRTEFDAEMKLISVTKPDGTKLIASETPSPASE